MCAGRDVFEGEERIALVEGRAPGNGACLRKGVFRTGRQRAGGDEVHGLSVQKNALLVRGRARVDREGQLVVVAQPDGERFLDEQTCEGGDHGYLQKEKGPAGIAGLVFIGVITKKGMFLQGQFRPSGLLLGDFKGLDPRH